MIQSQYIEINGWCEAVERKIKRDVVGNRNGGEALPVRAFTFCSLVVVWPS